MSDESEQFILLKSWHSAFVRATDFDAWGQPVEACEIYQRLSKQLLDHANDKNQIIFSKSQKRTLEKIALCLGARKKRLIDNESHQKKGIDLHDLKLLNETLANLLRDEFDGSGRTTFPVDLAVTDVNKRDEPQHRLDEDEMLLDTKGTGTLLPKPLPVSGKSFLTISLDHIGVKDGSQFFYPSISVSVRDQCGQSLDCTQDTPKASNKLDKSIIFHYDIHIQTAMESLPPGFAIFFEFKHFKPKKDSDSTWCWAFIEHDEIKEGPVALELYKKPTDFKRKSLKLLTVKPLYLHLQLSFNH